MQRSRYQNQMLPYRQVVVVVAIEPVHGPRDFHYVKLLPVWDPTAMGQAMWLLGRSDCPTADGLGPNLSSFLRTVATNHSRMMANEELALEIECELVLAFHVMVSVKNQVARAETLRVESLVEVQAFCQTFGLTACPEAAAVAVVARNEGETQQSLASKLQVIFSRPPSQGQASVEEANRPTASEMVQNRLHLQQARRASLVESCK